MAAFVGTLKGDVAPSGMFSRYALYFTPPSGDFARFGAAWLGWDVVEGCAVSDPTLDSAALTERPRKYGFHATLKPPFMLADGMEAETLLQTLTAFCARETPVPLGPLRLTRLGRFLALTAPQAPPALTDCAARVVETFDPFRRPATASELAQRDKPHLTDTQRANLHKWGYPHVMEDFRFHMTLTDRLDRDTLAATESRLDQNLKPILPDTVTLDALTLLGEASDGRFRQIARVPLGAYNP